MATAVETKLKLEAPEALAPIVPAQAAGLVPLKLEETSALDTKVEAFVAELSALDSNSPEFGRKVDELTSMGRKEIAEAASHSNRFLDRPVKAIDSDTGIGANLSELRRTVEDLDPGRQGALTAPKKLFGLIPYGNKMRVYFDSYKSSQTHISAILARLASGKDELLMDNAAIDTERASQLLDGFPRRRARPTLEAADIAMVEARALGQLALRDRRPLPEPLQDRREPGPALERDRHHILLLPVGQSRH